MTNFGSIANKLFGGDRFPLCSVSFFTHCWRSNGRMRFVFDWEESLLTSRLLDSSAFFAAREISLLLLSPIVLASYLGEADSWIALSRKHLVSANSFDFCSIMSSLSLMMAPLSTLLPDLKFIFIPFSLILLSQRARHLRNFAFDIICVLRLIKQYQNL